MATNTDTILDNFITDAINNVVTLGGTLVDDAEYERRVSICNGCDKQKEISVLGLKMVGCSLCGCPTATKPRYKTYFSATKFKIIEAICPHKDGNKWAIAADT